MPTFKYQIGDEVFEAERELTESELKDVANRLGLLKAEAKQAETAYPIVGGILGSVIGGSMGGGPGALIGGGLGSAGGEAVRQQIAGEDDPANIAKEGALGVLGEGAGQVIGRVGPAIVGGIKTGLGLEKEPAKGIFSLAERQAAQQQAQSLGTSIPASRVSGDFSQLLEGLSRTGIGEGTFVAAEKQLAEAFTQEAKNIVDKTTTNVMSDIEVGDALRASLEGADKEFKSKIGEFYRLIEKKGGTVPVFVDNIAAKADRKLQSAMAASREGRIIGLDEDIVKVLQDVKSLKSTLTFTQANEIRSNFLSAQRALGAKYGPNSEASKVLNEYIGDLTAAMDEGAKNLNPKLYKLYSAVNTEYKTVIRDLYDETVIKLLNKTPERLGESMARTGNVTEVLKIRKALNQARKQGQNVQKIEENLVSGYLTAVTKDLSGTLKGFTDLNAKMKDKQFKRTYDIVMQLNPTAKNNMAKLLKAAEISSRGNAPTILQGRGGVGGLLNTIALFSGTAGYAAGEATGAGIAVASALAIQGAAGKAMTTPLITNILLSAENIAQKKGVNAALEFLSKSQVFRRWVGQELSRSDFGYKFEE